MTIIVTILVFTLCSMTPGMVFADRTKPMSSWQYAMQRAIKRFGVKGRGRLVPYFERANVHYPPRKIGLLTFKKERKLELWAMGLKHHWHHIKSYPLTKYSGDFGPKLHDHDDQIPEGIYHISWLNPQSIMHLSMKLNYPNRFDKQHASWRDRGNMGGDIFIHGGRLSVGCVAVGDSAIEELFDLVYRVGRQHVEVINAPNDLRKSRPVHGHKPIPRWAPELYRKIELALLKYHETV